MAHGGDPERREGLHGKTETDVHRFVDELQEMTDEELKDYINEGVNKIAVISPGND